ncbi:unnamed protein product [Zymoseptoria tritici ST99CH_1E4]|uniref:Nascent polypeptide-associated complex subunit alpha-like UBA domain-containing protein n=1 Tax=Zymoseptoria tritici ST99CH_1E4 TaxID=1276532 RepID=A0A2H1FLM5_ZYMTR|nr:unnamed protein product [Zymoseptoria tritici ST99CH_1E4]
MAEPQPSNVTEGADPTDVIPATAEDRKAAQAMSSLDAKGDDNAAPKKEVDLKALEKAMKDFEINQKPKTSSTGGTAVKKEEAPKKIVKVDPADVALLIDQLDLNKAKATELLREHDADVLKAMRTWVSSAV